MSLSVSTFFELKCACVRALYTLYVSNLSTESMDNVHSYITEITNQN